MSDIIGATPVTPPNPYKKAPSRFKRMVLLVCLAAILGGGTLGAGLGAGYAAARHYLPETPEAEETFPAFSMNNAETNIVPVNVQVNNFSGIVKTVAESVCSINVTAKSYNMFSQEYEAEGAGSGIIFALDDKYVYVATNNHVIDGVDSISISLDDNENVPAKLVGKDADSDLAVISVVKEELDALGVAYRVATFGNSSAMEVGDQVVAIGNSMGEGQTATSGIISAVNKQITVDAKTLNVMQTDAAINMGNSGGPLVNANGEVIGINTAKLFASGSENVEGMGYSIPTDDAVKILESLRADGTIKKPYLGILSPRTIDEETKELFSLPSTGVLVTDVEAESGAGKAGVQSKDLIVGYNDIPIEKVEDLVNALAAAKVGDEITIHVYRGEVEMSFTVVLGNANER